MSIDAELNALCEEQLQQLRKEARELGLEAHRMWTTGAFKAGDEQVQGNLRFAFECLRLALEEITGWRVSVDFRQPTRREKR